MEKFWRNYWIANHELPEINYDISREGDIYTSVDMKADIVDLIISSQNFMQFHSELRILLKKLLQSMI
jgi:hypothetical protein